jgi:hypothetical protein
MKASCFLGAVFVATLATGSLAKDFCGRITSLPDAWLVHTPGSTVWFNAFDPPVSDSKAVYEFLNTHHDCDKVCCCIAGSVRTDRNPRRTSIVFTEVTGLKTCSGKVLR